MRDITKRFVIVYNGWPLESFDEIASAKQRTQELMANQTRSLENAFPNKQWNVRPLWKVTDVLGPAEQKAPAGIWMAILNWVRSRLRLSQRA